VNSAHDHSGLSLPGYTLSTRLGAGGYGEVWLAHAPGGLTKAVKFIFGSYNDKRAEHELRALQKVKEVRHPFLLSLERIEVVDGRLVIVTELAESSLKDRFDECIKQGLPGIPRTELLSYLRDAADALDYLSHKHSLQHLDVKPENLLIVAGHVKVADFGLVKDVGKSQASLVGGLTPLYSAPEVFQGNPTVFSDQYSLAVLYQEMLTGVLPFSGATAAELTLQHLHEDPDLSALPNADRYILSRALSKEPTQRYDDCMALITALLNAESAQQSGSTEWVVAESAATAVTQTAPPVRRPGPVTEFFGEDFESAARDVTSSMLLPTEMSVDGEAVELEPLDTDAMPFSPQPALVLGIGGAAGEVLKQFRVRTAKQFGEERVPAIQMLLLDSDAKSISHALQGDARTALKPEETLSLPLRRPQEYRDQSSRLMRWLSRRWLYNIPRSLRTEGMRPLGRLALADHARQAVQRIRMALSAATGADALEQSRERTSLDFQGHTPRVYVVAAVSGGSGSGMSIDVGYAVRAALDKMGAEAAQIIGIFLYGSGGDPRRCDLAKVNTYAWLTEYNHFHRPGGAFPGDESCGLPAMPPGRKAFDAAYLVDLGVETDESELQHAAQGVAEYIYADALTPAQGFFAACRQDDRTTGAAAPLRTFAVHKDAAASDDLIDRAAATLSREVVLGWTGGDVTPSAPAQPGQSASSLRDTNQIVQGAAVLVGQLQLKLEGLASNARSLVENQFGGDQQAFLENLLATLAQDGRPLSAIDSLRAIDHQFHVPAEEQAGHAVLQRPLEAIVSPLSMKLASDLSLWVLRKLDDRQERLAGAQRAAQWLVDHLKRVESDATRLSEGLARQTAAFVDELRRDPRADAAPASAKLARALAYFRMRIDQHAVWASIVIVRKLLGELKSVGATVAEFGRHLKHLAVNLPSSGDLDAAAKAGDPLARVLVDQLPTLTDAIDSQIQAQFINEQGGLFTTIMGNSRVRAQMMVALGKLARTAAERLAARPDVLNTAFTSLVEGQRDDSGAVPSRSGQTLPPLLERGGVYRRLTIVPAECARSQPQSQWAGALGNASLVAAPGQDVIRICEGWQLPLQSVALNLIQRRRDYADFAGRVQTRSDVSWTPLASPLAAIAPPASAFAGLPCDAPTITHVIS
jgi:hypothetical protein